RIEEGPRPADAALILRGIAPAGMNVHEEVRPALRVGGGVRRDAAHRAAEMADEDLALAGRQAADRVDHDRESSVGELDEIVALPVVAGARREQRVEGR